VKKLIVEDLNKLYSKTKALLKQHEVENVDNLLQDLMNVFTKFKLPTDDDVCRAVTAKYDDFILNNDWLKCEYPHEDIDYKGMSKLEFIKNLKDGDCVINRVFFHGKYSRERVQLYSQMFDYCKSKHRDLFIEVNKSNNYDELDGLSKRGEYNDLYKFYNDNYYENLVYEVMDEVANLYTKEEVLKLFENNTDK
jgi:hypothetical protein